MQTAREYACTVLVGKHGDFSFATTLSLIEEAVKMALIDVAEFIDGNKGLTSQIAQHVRDLAERD